MNLLITGYTGFVGTHIINNFKAETLIGLDITHGINVSQHYDWESIHHLPDTDVIIHLAGKAHDTSNTTSPELYYEINLGLTETIFEYFIKSSAKVFIFFSSVKAVADTVIGEYLTEDAIKNPLTPYGQSKLAAEKFILKQDIPEGKKVYILRPAMIHGPGNKGNLNLLFSLIQKGVPYPLGAFQNERSYTSVENLLYIINRLLEGEIPSDVYNICDDTPLSTIEVVQMIYDSLEKKHKTLNIPQSIVKMIAHIGDIIRLPLNSERLRKLTDSYMVSNDKIKEALSIASLPIESRKGMRRTIRSFTID
jgi:nucleoside-diphosphate-sugar epimerase